MEATEEEGVRAGGGPADRGRCRGQGRHVAAWVWYKAHGTGRGAGSTVPSPPFLLEAAQGPWSPILRCPVPVTSPLSPPPAPSSAGLRGHTKPKVASPLAQAGQRGWAERVAAAGSQLPMTAGLGTAGLSPPLMGPGPPPRCEGRPGWRLLGGPPPGHRDGQTPMAPPHERGASGGSLHPPDS